MAGIIEVFLDTEAMFRFRIMSPDGAVMAVSESFADKPAAAAGIAAVRECAGTGLVSDLSGPVSAPQPAAAPDLASATPDPDAAGSAAAAPAALAAEPACEDQRVPADRVSVNRMRAFAHFTARGGIPATRWTGGR
jgi:uncharacterized protein